jgi:DNA-binding NarL/FixJ family response regulator
MDFSKIDIHICDDHAFYIASIKQLMEELKIFNSVSSSSSKIELLNHLKIHSVDILFLDINVAKINMLDEIGQIRKLRPLVKIIILSSYDSQNIIREAISKKADAYLFKNTEKDEILYTIDCVLKNITYISSGCKKDFSFKDNFQLINELTSREKEIIRLLSLGYPNKKISETLKISVTTVQTHRRNIYQKLNLKGVGELVSFAFENNLN